MTKSSSRRLLLLVVLVLSNALPSSAFAPLPKTVTYSSSWTKEVENPSLLDRVPCPARLTTRPLWLAKQHDDSSSTFSLVGALVVLLGVVLVHESGHYLAARTFGVHPEEFSIGFGPKLVQTKVFGDDFYLRAIPFGGYVRFSPTTLLPLPWQERVVVSSAGVFMNLLLATLMYAVEISFGEGLVQPVLEPGVLVTGIQEKASARKKLRPGDVITSINNERTKLTKSPATQAEAQQSITDVIEMIQATPQGGSVKLSILRNKRPMQVSITPTRSSPDTPPTIGVFLEPNVVGLEVLQGDSPLEAINLASKYTANMTKETVIGIFSFLGDLVSFRESPYQVRGPVGVLERASEVVSTRNVDSILNYVAGISINFGVVNLVPIPPTDGFQVFFILTQALVKELS